MFAASAATFVAAATTVALLNNRRRQRQERLNLGKISFTPSKDNVDCIVIFSEKKNPIQNNRIRNDFVDLDKYIVNENTLFQTLNILTKNYVGVNLYTYDVSASGYSFLFEGLLSLKKNDLLNIFLDDSINTLESGYRRLQSRQKTKSITSFRGNMFLRAEPSKTLKTFLSNPVVYNNIFKINRGDDSEFELLNPNSGIGIPTPIFTKIHSSLSNSNFLKSFNNYRNGELELFYSYKENRYIVYFVNENKYRSIFTENSELFLPQEIVYATNSVSKVINNNFFADSEILTKNSLLQDEDSATSLDQVSELDETWVKIDEPFYGDFLNGETITLTNDFPDIYFSRFRNRFALKNETDGLYYPIIEKGDGFIKYNSIPEESSEDWIIDVNIPDITIDNSKKSVITTTIPFTNVQITYNGVSADLSILHYKICQNLEQYRGYFQQNPGFNNENFFFGGDRNERFKAPFSASWDEKNSLFRRKFGNNPSSPYATIGEAFRFLDKGRFFIFYDFVMDLYLVRVDVKKLSEMARSQWFFDDNNCWRIMRLKNQNYRPVQEKDILKLIREGKNIWDECSIFKVKDRNDRVFIRDTVKNAYHDYHPEPESKISPFVFVVCQHGEDIRRVLIRTPNGDMYDERIKNSKHIYYERYKIKDELISIFDGNDMYAWEKLENAKSSIYSMNKYKGKLISNTALNCHIYRNTGDRGVQLETELPIMYNKVLITKNYEFNTLENCYELQVENLLSSLEIQEHVVDNFVLNYWGGNNDFRSHILDAVEIETWRAFRNPSGDDLLNGTLGRYYLKYWNKRGWPLDTLLTNKIEKFFPVSQKI